MWSLIILYFIAISCLIAIAYIIGAALYLLLYGASGLATANALLLFLLAAGCLALICSLLLKRICSIRARSNRRVSTKITDYPHIIPFPGHSRPRTLAVADSSTPPDLLLLPNDSAADDSSDDPIAA